MTPFVPDSLERRNELPTSKNWGEYNTLVYHCPEPTLSRFFHLTNASFHADETTGWFRTNGKGGSDTAAASRPSHWSNYF
ncbi:MAG TPA: hypothetical protein VNT99_21115 [Methylomirabilota bacterium]|nr:hypothetical protein [Methylomirabilota bacterium]